MVIISCTKVLDECRSSESGGKVSNRHIGVLTLVWGNVRSCQKAMSRKFGFQERVTKA